MQPGQFSLRLGWLGTYVQTQHDDFADVVGQGAIPIIHDQDIALTEARLSLDAGLTKRFSASLVVPFRVVSTSIVYRDGMGMPVQLAQPNIHHRDETLTGLGDPMLLGAFTDALGDVRITARLGLSVPLGRTEEDPFALGDMGLAHEHIQFGTGTFNPVAALEVARSWGVWRLAGFGFTQQIVYENSKGYQAGDRYATGVTLRRAIGRTWSVRGGPEFQAETAERWHGVKHTDEGNQGRLDVILGAGVGWSPIRNWSFDFALKVPVYTHVIGGQLEAPAIAEVGVAWSFGNTKPPGHHHEHGDEHDHDEHAEGDEHDHDEHDHAHGDAHADEHDHDEHAQGDEHPHGDEHQHGNEQAHEHAKHPPVDTTGADVADAGKGGQRVDLVPVAGKVTIFDFWAEWCEPCKQLEPVLVDLARSHPNVALRRVEVIDWDSPVAEQHLTKGGFGLPHLKIYNARGTLVLEQSSAPGKLGALIDSVRALVEPTPATTPKPPPKPPVAVKPLVIEITASDKGFLPNNIKVPRNRPVVLRFKRTVEKTCATEVAFDHDGTHELKDLPLGKAVDVAVTFVQPGTIEFHCAMNMYRGTITVQ